MLQLQVQQAIPWISKACSPRRPLYEMSSLLRLGMVPPRGTPDGHHPKLSASLMLAGAARHQSSVSLAWAPTAPLSLRKPNWLFDKSWGGGEGEAGAAGWARVKYARWMGCRLGGLTRRGCLTQAKHNVRQHAHRCATPPHERTRVCRLEKTLFVECQPSGRPPTGRSSRRA